MRWTATERRKEIGSAFTNVAIEPTLEPDAYRDERTVERADAIGAIVRGHLEHRGPTTDADLARQIGISKSDVAIALVALESKGAVLQVEHDRWCARLVARIYAHQRDRERARHPAVGVQHLMRFFLDWQHVAPQRRLSGTEGLARIITQLQGMQLPVGAWEETALPSRLVGYHAHLADELFARGEVTWARLSARPAESDDEVARRAIITPSRATPIALMRRADLPWLVAAHRGGEALERPSVGVSAEILAALEAHGALFFSDLCAETGRLAIEVANGLWDAVARGFVTADSFQAIRALLAGRYRHASSARERMNHAPRAMLRARLQPRSGATRAQIPPALAGGRWSLLRTTRSEDFEPDELAEAVAAQLLERWGVVFRDVVQREQLALSWREVLLALRRFEARGIVRGGYFVSGFSGEQFALPEALDALRSTAATPLEHVTIELAAADPLNLTGLLVPGTRIPAVRGRNLTLIDGLPVVSRQAETTDAVA